MRISDWSSDVCSSDLQIGGDTAGERFFLRIGQRIGHRRFDEAGRDAIDGDVAGCKFLRQRLRQDRKSVVKGRSVSVRLDLGGRRIIKKKNQQVDRRSANVRVLT